MRRHKGVTFCLIGLTLLLAVGTVPSLVLTQRIVNTIAHVISPGGRDQTVELLFLLVLQALLETTLFGVQTLSDGYLTTVLQKEAVGEATQDLVSNIQTVSSEQIEGVSFYKRLTELQQGINQFVPTIFSGLTLVVKGLLMTVIYLSFISRFGYIVALFATILAVPTVLVGIITSRQDMKLVANISGLNRQQSRFMYRITV